MALDTDDGLDVKAFDVLALAKKAVLASKQAISLIEESNLIVHNSDEFIPGFASYLMVSALGQFSPSWVVLFYSFLCFWCSFTVRDSMIYHRSRKK